MSDLLNIIDTNKYEFEHSGRKFIYDFNEISLEQAELAREIASFKITQQEMLNSEIDYLKFLNSKGAEWRLLVLSYLLLEEKNDKLIKFERAKISEYDKFVKGIKIADYEKVGKVIDDFFINIGMQPITSVLLQNTKNKQTLAMLSTILMSQNKTTQES